MNRTEEWEGIQARFKTHYVATHDNTTEFNLNATTFDFGLLEKHECEW